MARKVVNRLKRKPRHFIREWRKFRQLKQEQLAERVEMAAASISQIETYKQGWTDETLAALAHALNCEPGDLLTRDPKAAPGLMLVWDKIPIEERARALDVLRAFTTKDGTSG